MPTFHVSKNTHTKETLATLLRFAAHLTQIDRCFFNRVQFHIIERSPQLLTVCLLRGTQRALALASRAQQRLHLGGWRASLGLGALLLLARSLVIGADVCHRRRAGLGFGHRRVSLRSLERTHLLCELGREHRALPRLLVDQARHAPKQLGARRLAQCLRRARRKTRHHRQVIGGAVRIWRASRDQLWASLERARVAGEREAARRVQEVVEAPRDARPFRRAVLEGGARRARRHAPQLDAEPRRCRLRDLIQLPPFRHHRRRRAIARCFRLRLRVRT
mmetsp:Transcript_10689/g.24813  ORF Transcript_10689/g.24813 Transcript_10689/m.24813 type:complete len:277 (-) Transcript_10689:140-970(-)